MHIKKRTILAAHLQKPITTIGITGYNIIFWYATHNLMSVEESNTTISTIWSKRIFVKFICHYFASETV